MGRAAVKHNFGKKIDSLSVNDYGLLQIARVTINNAALASATAVHAAITLAAAAANITTAITNPVTPRVLTVKGNQAGVAGNVVITGTNINDEAITETIVAADAGTIAGLKAFKTVTNINVPALVGAGDTIAIGTGPALGIPYKMAYATDVLKCYFAGAAETLAAQTVSTSDVSLNTVTTTTALDGVKDLVIDIMVK